MPVRIKRIYEEKSPEDGKRILVDRVWPRGVSKAAAQLDAWIKDAGPSHELRKWYAHDTEKFTAFSEKYKKELESGMQKEALDELKSWTKSHHNVTLLFAAKEEKYNQAAVLKELLDGEE